MYRSSALTVGDPFLAPTDVRDHDITRFGAGWSPETDRLERSRLNPKPIPTLDGLLIEILVVLVEPKEVFPLDVENQHPQVGGAFANNLWIGGKHSQEEQGEACLGGHSADPGNRHVSALASIEEIEIDKHLFAVAAEADRQGSAHFVGV